MTRTGGLCQGELAMSLILMCIMWVCTSICYQIINIYLKYIPGNEFINISIAGVAEIAAHLSVGFLFNKAGVRWTFFIGYCISVAGGACMIF